MAAAPVAGNSLDTSNLINSFPLVKNIAAAEGLQLLN
jgi:hypothetical protein